jgi:hypothetical protein
MFRITPNQPRENFLLIPRPIIHFSSMHRIAIRNSARARALVAPAKVCISHHRLQIQALFNTVPFTERYSRYCPFICYR